MNEFIPELVGGTLIGLAASLLWLGIGRISGMTGVLFSLFLLREKQRHWAFWFLAGLVLAYPLSLVLGYSAAIVITNNTLLLGSAGLAGRACAITESSGGFVGAHHTVTQSGRAGNTAGIVF